VSGCCCAQIVEQKGQPPWDEVVERWKENGQDEENIQGFVELIQLLTRLSTEALSDHTHTVLASSVHLYPQVERRTGLWARSTFCWTV